MQDIKHTGGVHHEHVYSSSHNSESKHNDIEKTVTTASSRRGPCEDDSVTFKTWLVVMVSAIPLDRKTVLYNSIFEYT